MSDITDWTEDEAKQHHGHEVFPYVSIEGLLGAGKTSVVRSLKDDYDYDLWLYFFAPEEKLSQYHYRGRNFNPVNISACKSSSKVDDFVFHHHMCQQSFDYYYDCFTNRDLTHWSFCDYLKIFEGSLYSFIPLIQTYAKHAGLSDWATSYLLSFAEQNIMKAYSYRPGMIIYLSISEQLALKRIQERSKPVGQYVTLEWLKTLKETQLQYFMQVKEKFHCPLIIVDVDENTSLNDVKSKCYHHILSLYRYLCTKCRLKRQLSELFEQKRRKAEKFWRRPSLPVEILSQHLKAGCNMYKI